MSFGHSGPLDLDREIATAGGCGDDLRRVETRPETTRRQESDDADREPSTMKDPGQLDVVIFGQTTEDIYEGIEWEKGTADAGKGIECPVGHIGRVLTGNSM